MANITQEEVWMMQYATFFVTRMGYRTVAVQQAKDEIWIVHPKHAEYPVIRLCRQAIGDDYFDRDRIALIHRAILDLFKREGRRLELHAIAEAEAELTEDEQAVQMHVFPQVKFPQSLIGMYPGIEQVCHASQHINEDFIRLSQELETFQIREMKRRQSMQSLLKKEKRPIVTLVVAAICIVVFLIGSLMLLKESDSIAISIMCGAYYKAFVLGLHEYWRFLSAGFVHFDIFHLLMNMISLYYMGPLCEKVYGKGRYLTILLVSIVMGNLFTFIGDGNVVAGGLSGGLYGLMAAVLVYFLQMGYFQQKPIRNQFLYMLFMNLLISLMPGISFLGHAGGFVAGAFLAVLCTKKESWKHWRNSFAGAFLVLCIAIGYMLPQSATLDEVYGGTDQAVIRLARAIGLDGYADHVTTIFSYYE